MDFRKILLAICPHGKPAILDGFAAALPQVMAYAELNSNLRLAMFLAQCAHESAGFSTTTELASGRAYEGRKDLGNTQPGDGERFKGRGLIQLTGRDNYHVAGLALGLPLETNPSRAAEFPAAAMTAAWFWQKHDLNLPADKGSVSAVTLRINGGENGLASREAYYKRALAAISDLKGALAEGAASETKKSNIKGVAAVIGAAAAPVASQAVAPSGSMVFMVLAAVVVVGAGFWIAGQANKHKAAAVVLTTAAKGV